MHWILNQTAEFFTAERLTPAAAYQSFYYDFDDTRQSRQVISKSIHPDRNSFPWISRFK